MTIYYFIPILAIVGVLVYTKWAQGRIQQAVAEGKGPELFHNGFAGYFSSIGKGEYIIAAWQGLAYVGSQSAAAQVGGALLNEISSKAIGFSKYVPQVFVAVTSRGRVLVAEEYSDMGDRGNYREALSLEPGATAVTGPTAIPEHQGPPPKNPYNPSVPLELARVTGAEGSGYACWLSPQSLEVTGMQRPVSAVLPLTAEAAAGVWASAVERARPQAA